MVDKSDNEAKIGECQHTSYHLPQWDENGKCSWVDIQRQHKSLNAEAKCIVPPTKVIPVIFIPGIMGTNLKHKYTKESLWKSDLTLGIDSTYLIPKSGAERREILNPDTTIIDNRKASVSPKIHTRFSDDGGLFPTRYERHWGEALYLSYGEFLSTFQYALLDDWQKHIAKMANMKKYLYDEERNTGVLSHLIDKKLGDKNDSPLNKEELEHFKLFLFPVHVFGYNWLVDNATSAEELVKYIDEVLKTYKNKHGYGLAIEKVILVTHSMGGLVARYAMNPSEDSTFKGCKDKVLGVVHGVIPDLGSPAAYRRIKTGAGQEGKIVGQVLGGTARTLMPVLARATSALQLLPYPTYKSPWLTIKNDDSYPKAKDPKTNKNDPFSEIYLRNDVWWKMYEPDIIDSDPLTIKNNWNEYSNLMRNKVKTFMLHQEKGLYHPNTYVFYGNEVKSDNWLEWKLEYEGKPSFNTGMFSLDKDKYREQISNNRYMDVKKDGSWYQQFVLIPSEKEGDGTVPIESLYAINNSSDVKSILKTNVEHQSAYGVDGVEFSEFTNAVKFTLRSIIKMVQDINADKAK